MHAMNSYSASSSSIPAERSKIYPWIVVVFSAFFLLYKYVLQLSPGVMTNELMRDFHLNGTDLGYLAASYFYAYFIMQLIGGYLLDRFEPKYIITAAIFISATASVFFAEGRSFIDMFIARTLMGVGVAIATIGYIKMTSFCFDAKRFAFVTGLLATAAMVGSLFGELPLSYLTGELGWRHSMEVVGFLGIGLGILYAIFVKPTSENPSVDENLPQGSSSFAIFLENLLKTLKNRQNWLLALYAGLSFSPVAVFGGLWGNPFLQSAYHVSSNQASSLISLVFFGLAFGSPFFGWLSDRLNNRAALLRAGMIFSGILLSLIIYGNWHSEYFLGILLFIFGFTTGVFMLCYTVASEINPAWMIGTVVALINSGDPVFGALGDPVIGKILDLFWKGNIVNGVHVFSVHAYQIALSILPLYVLIAFFVSWFIKERR